MHSYTFVLFYMTSPGLEITLWILHFHTNVQDQEDFSFLKKYIFLIKPVLIRETKKIERQKNTNILKYYYYSYFTIL